MARPTSNTVDYFPHVTHHGLMTLSTLESRFGNDGYACWFKLLESLGAAENHVLDFSDEAKFECFAGRVHVSCEFATEMLNLMAKLRAIDAELWNKSRIVWCQNFVDGIAQVYARRGRMVPIKPISEAETPISDSKTPVSEAETPQSKVKKTKEEYKIHTRKSGASVRDEDFERFWLEYPRKTGKAEAYKSWKRIVPDSDMVDMMIAAINKQWEDYYHKIELRFIPHPATWLNNERWNDDFSKHTKEKEEDRSWEQERKTEHWIL